MVMTDVRFKCLLSGALQIVQVTDDAQVTVLKGSQMSTIKVLDGDCYSLVVGLDGRIADILPDSEMISKYAHSAFDTRIDVTGKVLMPGFVDAHTHPVFAGDRVHEFAMKLAGATYMEVHQAGGGINFTVEKTRQATEDQLYEDFSRIATCMLQCGTTLLEAKSGYGLNTETELKMLKVLQRTNDSLPLEISGTFCGAHAIPKGFSDEQATDDVINRQLPSLKAEKDAGRLDVVENVDVFCEKGVFTIDQSRRILKAGQEIGLSINFHGDELHPTKSAELGAELQSRVVSHLEEISEQGITDMAKANTIAVVLPTTAYILRLKPTPVRQMIQSGVAVALGSDFNPNAFCYSMPMVMHLGCVIFRMSLQEALAASTINAAASLGRGHSHGSLHIGKVADIVVVDAQRWEHIIYQFGCHSKLISAVLKNGQSVYENVHN